MRFYVIDTETTGFKVPESGGGICDISIREVDENLQEVNHFYSRLDPEYPISASAAGVHGIKDSDVVDCPTWQEWIDIVLEYDPLAEPFYLIAHNAKFDEGFLKQFIKADYKCVDTLLLARRYYPDAENHKLGTLRVLFDFPDFDIADAHSAGGDTKTLLYLVQQLTADTGLTLQELCEDAQRKDPITKMSFGKYKGQLITEVKKSDPKYIEWVLTKMDNLNDDLRQAIQAA